MNAFKQFHQAFQVEAEEFTIFSQEFRKGVEHWQTCVVQAEFSAAKIRDHVLNDPDRISRASVEAELRTMRSEHGKKMFTTYLKFMEDVNKRMNSLVKTKRKQGDTFLKLEEAKGQHMRKGSQMSMRKVVSLETELENSNKSKEDMISQLRQQCLRFLNQVQNLQDREMLRTAILSKLGDEYGDVILGGLVFDEPPPQDDVRASQALPEYIPQDEVEVLEIEEQPKADANLNKSFRIREQKAKEKVAMLPPQYGDDENDEKNQIEPYKVPELKSPVSVSELKSPVNNEPLPPVIDEKEIEEVGEGGEGGEPPEEFLDPISKKLMNDPVVLLEDGNTYDRESILNWLETHDTSPVTGQVLGSKDVAPNNPIKQLIEEFKAGNP
jgi:hypothetical protein